MLGLTRETVACSVEVSDWRGAVEAAGQLLCEAGHVEARYIQAMIRAVQELGPYIVIAPGIAMPHARPECGVKRNGMAVITLKEPVNFGSHNDPVSTVIAFSAIEVDTHIRALKALATVLEDKERVGVIQSATQVDEILSAFEVNGLRPVR